MPPMCTCFFVPAARGVAHLRAGVGANIRVPQQQQHPRAVLMGRGAWSCATVCVRGVYLHHAAPSAPPALPSAQAQWQVCGLWAAPWNGVRLRQCGVHVLAASVLCVRTVGRLF